MKYPRLPPELDLRRKLMPEDIDEIREKHARLKAEGLTDRQTCITLARMYGVSPFTIYYWTHNEFREYKRRQNALAHSKLDMKDYVRHRAREIQCRRERMRRYPLLKLWHAYVSAKNEKRCVRRTVHGVPLSELGRVEGDKI